jgi:hypothetical protein
VIVQLSPEAADAVHGGDQTPSNLREAQEKLRSLGLRLEPLHVRAEDPSLAAWFRVSVEDEPTAEEIAATLRKSPAVESAYVEPPSAPPAEATPVTRGGGERDGSVSDVRSRSGNRTEKG